MSGGIGEGQCGRHWFSPAAAKPYGRCGVGGDGREEAAPFPASPRGHHSRPN